MGFSSHQPLMQKCISDLLKAKKARALSADLARLDHEDALEDLGQVSEVEGVMRFGWCGQQLLAYAQVHLNAAFHHGLQQSTLHI